MSVNATFQADFSDFTSACQKAEVSLRGFETGAGKVETSLNRVTNSLSGTKLISDAALMAEAVDRVGGVSKLTEKELARVSAQAQEATAKLVAMGRDVPPGIQKIADATKSASKETADWKGALTSAAGAFGIAFSVGSIVQFGKSVFDSASKVHDLASQLGISTDAAQGFQYAAEQAGSSIDAVGTALNKMNSNLAEGDKSTVKALKDAGLAFSDIRSMKPEDAFLAITDAIQQIPDPMVQSDVALKLFGKSAAELLPAIKEGFRGAADGASKMSAQTIKDLEAAQDAWAAVGREFTIVTGTVIADLMRVPAAVSKVGSSFVLMQAFVGDMALNGFAAAAAHMVNATKALDENKAAADALAPAVHKTADELSAGAAATKKYAAAMEDIRAAAIPLTAAQMAVAVSNEKLGISADKTATQLHIGAEAVSTYLDSLKNGAEITETWRKAIESISTAGTKGSAASTAFIAKWVEDSQAAARKVAIATGKAIADQVVAYESYHDKNAQAALMGADLQIHQIERARDASIRALKEKSDFESGVYAKAIAEMDIYYDHLVNEAEYKKLHDEWAQMETESKKASASLDSLAQSFLRLAQVGGQAFGPIMQGMAALIVGLDAAKKANAEWGGSAGIASGLFSDEASKSDKWAAGMASAGAVASGAMNVWNATAAESNKAVAALKGAMGGAQAGAVFGPWGAAIGAAAGALTGFLHSMFGAAGRDLVKEFAATFGGFDSLHVELNALGAEGEKLWIALTQGVGRNNPKEAQAAIDAITKALQKKSDASDEAVVMSEAEAQATIETAAAAAKALDDVNGRLKINRDAWGEWSEDVTGYLQKLADEIRAMPLPTPTVIPSGTSSGAGGSALYRGRGGAPGGGEAGAVHVYIGNQAVDDHVLRVVRTRTPGDLMVRGR